MFTRFDYIPRKNVIKERFIEKCLNDMIENEIARQELEKHEKKIDNNESLERLLEEFLMDLSNKSQRDSQRETSGTTKKNTEDVPKKVVVKPSKEIIEIKARIGDLEVVNNGLKQQNEELLKRNEELLQRIESIELCLNRISDIVIKHSKEIEIMEEFNRFSQNTHKKTDEQIDEINVKISEMKKIENKLSKSIDKAIHIFEMLH